MIIHKDSHLDHGLTARQLAHILQVFDGRDGFFRETIELPIDLGTVECGLYGPAMGDGPVASSLVVRQHRGGRKYPSRILPGRGARPTSLLTVVAGPHDGFPCVLWTTYGGPAAPREPDDPELEPENRAESIAFWAEHALVDGGPS